MLHVKLSPSDGETIRLATVALAISAREENKHKKAREAAKTIIERELEKLRGIKLDDLQGAQIVIVQCDGVDLLKIERKESQRLDATALGQAHPELVAQFTKPSVASYFSSLLVTA